MVPNVLHLVTFCHEMHLRSSVWITISIFNNLESLVYHAALIAKRMLRHDETVWIIILAERLSVRLEQCWVPRKFRLVDFIERFRLLSHRVAEDAVLVGSGSILLVLMLRVHFTKLLYDEILRYFCPAIFPIDLLNTELIYLRRKDGVMAGALRVSFRLVEV